jgi:REP element-mobilizing transposase RayT
MTERTDFHICPRGVRRGLLFENDGQKLKFLELLGKFAPDFDVEVLGYVLMDNHYHLLANMPFESKPAFVKMLNWVYAKCYNEQTGQSGHVFESSHHSFERWGSSLLLYILKYFFLNPVVAGLVDDPLDFPFSSFAPTIGIAPKPDWLKPERLLRCLSPDLERARVTFRKYVENGRASAAQAWHLVDVWLRKNTTSRGMHGKVHALEYAAMMAMDLSKSLRADTGLPLQPTDLLMLALDEIGGAPQTLTAMVLNKSQGWISRRLSWIRSLRQDDRAGVAMDRVIQEALLAVPDRISLVNPAG